MSVQAVRSEINSLRAYGHLHVDDARILVSLKTLGRHTSPSEHALLRDFQRDVVHTREITSSRAARETLDAAVAAGPTSFWGYAKSAALGALAWGAAAAIGMGVASAALVGVTAAGAGLAAAATVGVCVIGAGLIGAAIGAWRAVRD